MVNITDETGRIVFEKELKVEPDGNVFKFQLPELSGGLYFVIINGENISYSGKVVKRRKGG